MTQTGSGWRRRRPSENQMCDLATMIFYQQTCDDESPAPASYFVHHLQIIYSTFDKKRQALGQYIYIHVKWSFILKNSSWSWFLVTKRERTFVTLIQSFKMSKSIWILVLSSSGRASGFNTKMGWEGWWIVQLESASQPTWRMEGFSFKI